MQPTPPPWPDQPPQSPQAPQPPTSGGGPSGSRLAMTLGIVSIVSVIVIVALIGTLIVVLQRGASSGTPIGGLQPGAASAQTATTSSVQATSTAQGTPVASGTSGTTPHKTPTPKPTATPAGPPSVQIFSNQLSGKSNTPIGVICPKGELALSGGWSSTARSIPITFSKRSGNGWQVLINTLSVGLIPTTTVYVVCLRHVAGAAVTERQATLSADPGKGAQPLARCNPDEILVGGGLENSGFILYYMLETVGPGVIVSGSNNTSTQQTVTAYAECLQASSAKVSAGSANAIQLGPGSSAGGQATCPDGALASGGMFYTQQAALAYDFSPSDSSTWQAHALFQGTGTAYFQFHPLCLSFS